MGLYEIKDFPPAYTNTFYFFDCDFKKCVSDLVEEYVCFSKTVAYDTANIVFAKDNTELYDAMNKFIKIIKEDGTLQEISEKWVGADITTKKE